MWHGELQAKHLHHTKTQIPFVVDIVSLSNGRGLLVFADDIENGSGSKFCHDIEVM